MMLFKKILTCCFSALLIFTLSGKQAWTAELTGKITGIKGETLYIEMSTKELPRKGDPATIILDLDGEGFEAGKAEVIEIQKNRVTAKTIEDNPSIDMKILIQTDGPSTGSSAYQDKSSPQMSTTFAATAMTGTVTAKRGDSVKVEFSTEIQGIKVNAGTDKVTKVDEGAVWVKTSDKRPNLKMAGIIYATGSAGRGRSVQWQLRIIRKPADFFINLEGPTL